MATSDSNRQTLIERVNTRIQSSPAAVFDRATFSDLAGYDQVGRALRELCKSGTITKAATGLYAKSSAPAETVSEEISKMLDNRLSNANRSRRNPRAHTQLKTTMRNATARHLTSMKASRPRLTSSRVHNPVRAISASEQLGLKYPYDWSNPNIPQKVLVQKVLERGLFDDMAVITAKFGVTTVQEVANSLGGSLRQGVSRKLRNIISGISLAH